jgi:uncharacterized membrane protein
MARIERSIDVDVPAWVAYDQWTQFEDFPRFMDGVDRVVQDGDKFLRWSATIGGQRREWTAEIVDQTPYTRIAWRSIDGAVNAGAVLFTPIGPDRTRVALTIEAEPDDPVEVAGTALGFLQRRVEGDLDRFKEFIEQRRAPTGAWTGEIHGERVDQPR